MRGCLLFDENILPEFSFKLTEFTVQANQINPGVQRNLNLFLKNQSSTLDVLSIESGTFFNAEVVKTVLSMPRLKKFILSAGRIRDLAPVFDTSQRNHSVTALHLTDYESDHVSIQILLKAFPNVETFSFRTMRDEMAEFIAKHCKNLKHLSVSYFHADNISNEEFYLNLETFRCAVVNTNCSRLYEKLCKR